MPARAQRLAATFAILALSAAAPAARAAPPDVVVSIAPVHSLVASIMADVGSPRLLIPANASPHAYSLRPSDAQMLAAAGLVFRVGPELETFLDKPLAALAAGTVIDLADAPGITQQEIAADGAEAHGHRGEAAHARDPHIWLSTANARRIGAIAAEALSRHDPANAAVYAANLAHLDARLDTLAGDLRAALAPAKNAPYVVMHDAYSHFEAEFGLKRVAAITLSAERRPGARRLRAVRDLLAAQDIRCVFAEPQFPHAIAATVVDGINARLGRLDPVGVDIPPGPELYFALMENLARNLADCLGS